jgi:hypothetical protein
MIEATLSVLGSIASIGAAIWAFIEAKKARRAADKAETVRGELIDRRKLVEVSQLLTETRRVMQSVSRVGPACTEKKIKGVDCSEIAREVEEYCRLLGDMESHFAVDFRSQAQKLRADLIADISELAGAVGFEQKKGAGMRIYEKIDSFSPSVKELLDEKREHSVAVTKEKR